VDNIIFEPGSSLLIIDGRESVRIEFMEAGECAPCACCKRAAKKRRRLIERITAMRELYRIDLDEAIGQWYADWIEGYIKACDEIIALLEATE